MRIEHVSPAGGTDVEIGNVGPVDGIPVVYFHSPSAAGEELDGAAEAAHATGLRLITLRRPSVAGDQPSTFLPTVADSIAQVVGALALERPAFLAWSGGAPYALASAARLGAETGPLHLVSPVPGALTGPDAVPNQSARLQEVARTTASSPWAGSPAALRDYQAVAAPWPFAVDEIEQPVTIWAPTDDEIVPPRLAAHLADRLRASTVIDVPGAHDWLIHNWDRVLRSMAGRPDSA